jgi:hypothetical protein
MAPRNPAPRKGNPSGDVHAPDRLPAREAPPAEARHRSTTYTSPLPFDENRIRAAAVYCSDGRFGEQCDDFLHNALKLPRYDRLAVPGGAACLADNLLAFREEEGVVEQLRFLIRVHGLQRLVLIAHQDCAFYCERLHVRPADLETRQREDMQTAAERIRSLDRNLAIASFFARKQSDGHIQFELLFNLARPK